MPLLLPGQFVLHLAMLERFVMPLYVSSYYPAIFSQNCHKFKTSLEYVGILCQEERSGRAYRDAWTIWPVCQCNSDVSSPQFTINSRSAEKKLS